MVDKILGCFLLKFWSIETERLLPLFLSVTLDDWLEMVLLIVTLSLGNCFCFGLYDFCGFVYGNLEGGASFFRVIS